MDRLKQWGWIGLVSVTASMGVILPAYAENPDHMRQLVRTGDCPGCDLSDTVLSELNLQGADLQGANLSGTRLRNVQLNQANLREANLSGARFLGTSLQGANLQGASLEAASSFFFCGVFAEGSDRDVRDCVMTSLFRQLGPQLCDDSYGLDPSLDDVTSLCTEDLESLFLASVSVFYGGGNLPGVNLTGADLTGADLTGADLTGVDLRYASLEGAIATDTNFSYALLFNATTAAVQNADLSTAWQTPVAVGQWLNQAFAAIDADAVRAEGLTNAGALGRAQQAHYLEFSVFSTNLEALGTGIEPETEHYRYGVISVDPDLLTVQYALSKVDDLKSYVTVVFFESAGMDDAFSVNVLCESPEAGRLQLADIPTPDASNRGCPAGWMVL